MERRRLQKGKDKGKFVGKKKAHQEKIVTSDDGEIATDHASIDELEQDITGPVKKGIEVKPDLLRGDHPDLAK